MVNAETREEVLNEITDIQELINVLIAEIGLKKLGLRKLQKRKNAKRGGFKKRLFLIRTEK